jgi:hypothetical protein
MEEYAGRSTTRLNNNNSEFRDAVAALNRTQLDDQFDIELIMYKRVDQKLLHHAIWGWFRIWGLSDSDISPTAVVGFDAMPDAAGGEGVTGSLNRKG